jgi:hypothetical protein
MAANIMNSGLVPTRFLCIIAHIVIVISILINRVNFAIDFLLDFSDSQVSALFIKAEHVERCDVSGTKTYANYDSE